jgi:hypothetical protein
MYIERNMDKYKNSRIFLYPTDSAFIGIVPVLRKYNFDFYDCHGFSYKDFNLYINQWENNKVYFEQMEKAVKETNKDCYLFISLDNPHNMAEKNFKEYYEQSNSSLTFERQVYAPNIALYKIIKN